MAGPIVREQAPYQIQECNLYRVINDTESNRRKGMHIRPDRILFKESFVIAQVAQALQTDFQVCQMPALTCCRLVTGRGTRLALTAALLAELATVIDPLVSR